MKIGRREMFKIFKNSLQKESRQTLIDCIIDFYKKQPLPKLKPTWKMQPNYKKLNKEDCLKLSRVDFDLHWHRDYLIEGILFCYSQMKTKELEKLFKEKYLA